MSLLKLLHPRTPAVGWVPGFGPSEEAQARFDSLAAEWRRLQAEGVPTRDPYKNQMETWRTWRAYAADWQRGTADLSKLQALGLDANRVRREVEAHKLDLAEQAKARGAAEEAARLAADAEPFNASNNLPIADVEHSSAVTNAAPAAQAAVDLARAVSKDAGKAAKEAVKDGAKAAADASKEALPGWAPTLVVLGILAYLLGPSIRSQL